MAKKRNVIAITSIITEEARTYVKSKLAVNRDNLSKVSEFEVQLASLLEEWTKD